MNYNTDRPITKQEDDLLGRSTFSKQLGKTIYEYNATDGLVIGLYGKWGTGKTSIINMTIKEINNLSKNNKDKSEPIIINFNPWNYSDKNNLISLFFQKLKNTLNINKNERIKNIIGDALNKYSDTLDLLNLAPVVGSTTASLLKILARDTGLNLMRNANLDETKELLKSKLLEADNKIIVIIDDIDRLTNSQIKDIFQLVKQVADLPNIIYILAMDRSIASNALSDIHNLDGNTYLEKIIQVPFEIPELSKSKLHIILDNKLKNSINKLPKDNSYLNKIKEHCVYPYIKNIRDINRLINTFQFRYNSLRNEISCEDMLGITCIEVLEPKLYKWIYNNKSTLCMGDVVDEKRKYYSQLFDIGVNPDLALQTLTTMFPKFLPIYDIPGQSDTYFRGNSRIAHLDKFDLYFVFDLNAIKISKEIINQCIFKLEAADLNNTINNINLEGTIDYFLKEMLCAVDKIPENRLNLIANTILNLEHTFIEKNQNYSYDANTLVFNILNRIMPEDKKTNFINSLIQNADNDSLSSIANIISRIKRAYENSINSEVCKKDQIISLDDLKYLEQKYVYKIHSILESNSIIDIKNFKWVIGLWERLDIDSAKKYIQHLFIDEINVLKFICGVAYSWPEGWFFYPESYSAYISKDKIYDIIQNFDKNNLFEFTETEQIKLASFILNYNENQEEASEKEAKELVYKWRISCLT